MIYGVRKVDVTLMKKNGCLMTFESGQEMNTVRPPPPHYTVASKKLYMLQKVTS